MNLPTWYRRWRGDKGFLPDSDGRGKLLCKKTLIPLEAQVAVFFGKPNGELKDLQQGVYALAQGDPIKCDCCGQELWDGGHSKDCRLVEMYVQVMKDPGGASFESGGTIAGKAKV